MKLLALSLLLLASFAQGSEDCASVDLRAEMRARGLPDRRHQDSTGWCYAFVAADLLSFRARANLSAADIARRYINAHPLAFEGRRVGTGAVYPLGGGLIQQALETARGGAGVCTETDFPSEDYAFSRESVPTPGDGVPPKPPSPPLLPLDAEALAGVFTHPHLAQWLALIRQNEFRRILDVLGRSFCAELHPVDVAPVMVERGAGMEEEMDRVLDQGRPFGMSYVPDILYGDFDETEGGTADHASVVVGRRFNDTLGRCEYLIRNTESGCDEYAEGYECENNHVWVPRRLVRAGALDVVSLP